LRQRRVVLAGLAVTLAGLLSSAAPVLAQGAAGGTSTQCQSLYSQYIQALTSSQYPAAEAVFATFVRWGCSLP
jgi:hypothetical protein